MTVNVPEVCFRIQTDNVLIISFVHDICTSEDSRSVCCSSFCVANSHTVSQPECLQCVKSRKMGQEKLLSKRLRLGSCDLLIHDNGFSFFFFVSCRRLMMKTNAQQLNRWKVNESSDVTWRKSIISLKGDLHLNECVWLLINRHRLQLSTSFRLSRWRKIRLKSRWCYAT